MTADLLIVSPPAVPPRNLAAQARHLHPAALPRWRAQLTERWREQLDEVSALSRACHRAQHAAANARQDTRQAAWRQASAAMQRAAAGWLALAEIEAALARLAAGRFGWCQHCGAAITAATLAQTPLARCCPACDGSP
jgi:DnaK suppressor protein